LTKWLSLRRILGVEMRGSIIAQGLALGILTFGASGIASAAGLSADHEKNLDAWLQSHPGYRLATEKDCDCADSIDEMRRSGPFGTPLPHYTPYVLTGDFRHNGVEDLAVVVVDRNEAMSKEGLLVIFDGPFVSKSRQPVYTGKVRKIPQMGLGLTNKGALIYGAFYSEGCIYEPQGKTYREACVEY